MPDFSKELEAFVRSLKAILLERAAIADRLALLNFRSESFKQRWES
jgi:hypothetical protein